VPLAGMLGAATCFGFWKNQSCDERRQMSFRATEGVGKRTQAVAGPLISPNGANSRKKES
jgi:hypothetical protein